MCPSTNDQGEPQPSSPIPSEPGTSSAKNMEAAALTAHEELLLRAQAQANDAYIAGIAHDLKNPLTTIMGRVELMKRLLQRAEITPADLQRHLAPLDAAVMRLNTLLEALGQARGDILTQREQS